MSAATDSLWEFIAAQPASGLPGYSYVAMTLFDSTAIANPYTTYFVQARSTDGVHWFSSEIDSGYSVDNLPPSQLASIGGYLAPPLTVTIYWARGIDSDLSHYHVYEGRDLDFPVDAAHRIVATPDTTCTVRAHDRKSHFKVTAVDIHGNESEPIVLAPGQITGIELLGVPAAGYLKQNRPNPFNPATTIEFGTPISQRVTIRVYTSTGRLVRTITDKVWPAGIHSAGWDGRDSRGIQLPSGIYVARLTSGGVRKSIKMVLAR